MPSLTRRGVNIANVHTICSPVVLAECSPSKSAIIGQDFKILSLTSLNIENPIVSSHG